ncbi:amidohydrolase family protein [Acidobacteriota bacterium]
MVNRAFLWRAITVCLIVFLFQFMSYSSASEHYDVLIKNAKIVDGTGKAAFIGNIAIKGDKILAVGKVGGEANTVIDGTGLVACPGFIDPHSHADVTIMQYPLAENLVMQGITTFVGGNCGMSPAPLPKLTFGDWLARVEDKGISVNMVPLIGLSTMRTTVMGNDWKREATAEELKALKGLLDEAMKAGAFGFSGGIDPPWPGYFASMEEKVELARVAKKYGGYYTPHTRHERSHWVTDNLDDFSYPLYYGPPEDIWVGRYRGLLEAIEVCRQSGLPLHIAHIPNAYLLPMPHPDYLEEAAARATLEIVDDAREEGLAVTCDVVLPPLPQFTQLIANEFLNPQFHYPDWLSKLKKEELIEKLRTKEFRAKVRGLYDASRMKFCMIHTKADPYWSDCFKIFKHANAEYVGETVGAIAKQRNIDPLEVVFDLVTEDPDAVWLHYLDRRYNEVAVATLIQHPVCEPCTDISAAPAELPQGNRWMVGPAHWGIYPYYIDTYVKEKGIFSLEEAVKKATSVPAKRLGLNRGILKPDYYADIVLFDFEQIKMTGDFNKPDRRPDGIECVLVNGKVTYKDKTHSGEKAGKVLRKTN